MKYEEGNETAIVQEIIQTELDRRKVDGKKPRVFRDWVIAEIQDRIHPSRLHNKAIEKHCSTKDGIENMHRGAEKVFLDAMRDLTEHYVVRRNGDIEVRPVSATEDQTHAPSDTEAMMADFPGWKPEDGSNKYGYPLLPDMAALTDDEVRKWGRHAIDAKAEYDLLLTIDAHEDENWMAASCCWSGEIIEAVEQRLGEADCELAAYAEEVYTEKRKELEDSVREEELADALDSYTDPTNTEYDPVFDKQIRELRPDWFEEKNTGGPDNA